MINFELLLLCCNIPHFSRRLSTSLWNMALAHVGHGDDAHLSFQFILKSSSGWSPSCTGHSSSFTLTLAIHGLSGYHWTGILVYGCLLLGTKKPAMLQQKPHMQLWEQFIEGLQRNVLRSRVQTHLVMYRILLALNLHCHAHVISTKS